MKPVLRGPLPFLVVGLLTASSIYGLGEKGGPRATASAPSLGTADSFAVVASSTVTNTGPSVVNGDLGVSPGNTASGFGAGLGTVNGTIHLGNATSLSAQNDITPAYNNLAGQVCDVNLTGLDLGGLTLTPGTYCFSSSAQLTGNLTLNALGNSQAVWVFQIGSTLTTASGSSVSYINSGQSCGTFWQVGSSATLGTTTTFRGNILALASISLNNGASNSGGLFARTGAVTLINNTVSRVGVCSGGVPAPTPTPIPGVSPGVTPTPTPAPGVTPSPGGTPIPPGAPGAPVPTLPEAAIWGLVAILLASGAFVLGRR